MREIKVTIDKNGQVYASSPMGVEVEIEDLRENKVCSDTQLASVKETIHADQLADMLKAATSVYFGMEVVAKEAMRVLDCNIDDCDTHAAAKKLEVAQTRAKETGVIYNATREAMLHILKKMSEV